MSNWFYLSLIAPILWTVVNHVDKYLLSKLFRTNVIGPIFLFSGFFSILVSAGVLLYAGFDVLNIPIKDKLILVITGSFNALAFYLYLYALKDEETSVVVPFMQLIPVFTYLLGYIFLDELLSMRQLFASIVILLGILFISVNIDKDNRLSLKRKIILVMSISSLFFALHDVVFKLIAVEDSFTKSTFWQYLGIFLVSLIVFIGSRKSRQDFAEAYRIHRFRVIYLSSLSEVLYVAGNLFSNFASLLAPVVLVSVVSSYQPMFVFISAAMLTVFLPNLVTERVTFRHLVQKSVSISLIIIGSYLLYTTN